MSDLANALGEDVPDVSKLSKKRSDSGRRAGVYSPRSRAIGSIRAARRAGR
jgi:hypothetical protein